MKNHPVILILNPYHARLNRRMLSVYALIYAFQVFLQPSVISPILLLLEVYSVFYWWINRNSELWLTKLTLASYSTYLSSFCPQ